jgi:serine/threonine protein kinase
MWPLALARQDGRTRLILEGPYGEPLDGILGPGPPDLPRTLHPGIGITAAFRQVHRHGLTHKDIKPTILRVDVAAGTVRLTRFGMASRLPREHQSPALLPMWLPNRPDGRTARSTRSDLYAFGATLDEIPTGTVPFTAADPMEWVYCRIARHPLPPGQRADGIPDPVGAIVLKLLAKTADGRCQTPLGLKRTDRGAWVNFWRMAASIRFHSTPTTRLTGC